LAQGLVCSAGKARVMAALTSDAARPVVLVPRQVTAPVKIPDIAARAGDAFHERRWCQLGAPCTASLLAGMAPKLRRRALRLNIRSGSGRGGPTRVRSVATESPKMSKLTLQLIARDILSEAEQQMNDMPASWASGVDQEGSLKRHAMTLGYLKTCYGEAMQAFPETFSQEQLESLEEVLKGLSGCCDEVAEKLKALVHVEDDNLVTVPKYYFSELRTRRSCRLPQAPKAFTERELLSFLTVEAVSNMRTIKRFKTIAEIAERRGDTQFADSWPYLLDKAKHNVSQIIRCMVEVYGEERVKEEMEACVRDESGVVLELYDIKSPPAGSPTAAMDDDDDDDDDDDFCLIQKPVFVVSDCTGESAVRTVRCALNQFGHCFDRSHALDITTIRFCTEVEMIDPVVEQAKDRDALVVFTLVDPRVNAAMVEACNEYDVEYLDLWSPLLNKLEAYFHTDRLGIPGRDDQYTQLIECIEYTKSLDDGVDPKRWADADLIIVGPSRSGKTPLSYFMAQRGFKVANYPLVPDEEPPKELWDFHQNRVFALTIKPGKLMSIRSTRMKSLKMGTKSNYASEQNVKSEIDWCGHLYRSNPKWRVIDTTDSGIEEISTRILQMLKETGVTPRFVMDNPSAI